MSSVCFVILTYYPTIKHVVSLLHSLKHYPIILVDNTPDTIKQLRPSQISRFRGVHLIKNNKNLGYTGGTTEGITFAYQNQYDWIIVLNDDLSVLPIHIDTFIKRLQKTSPGIAGPWPRKLDIKRWTTTIENDVSSFDFISGSFFAIHRDVIGKMGYFYLPYFIYYEEVEYCVRAKKLGFSLTYISVPNIFHNESASFAEKPYMHQYYLARNHLLFVERNAPLLVKLYEFIRLPKTLYEHIIKNEHGAVKGLLDYSLRRFGPYNNRYI